jgi:hypothetical protein
LNPIENAWNFMKNKLSNEDISSIPKLKEANLKMWTTWPASATPCARGWRP